MQRLAVFVGCKRQIRQGTQGHGAPQTATLGVWTDPHHINLTRRHQIVERLPRLGLSGGNFCPRKRRNIMRVFPLGDEKEPLRAEPVAAGALA